MGTMVIDHFVVCTKIFQELIGPYKNLKEEFSLDSGKVLRDSITDLGLIKTIMCLSNYQISMCFVMEISMVLFGFELFSAHLWVVSNIYNIIVTQHLHNHELCFKVWLHLPNFLSPYFSRLLQDSAFLIGISGN